MKGRTSSRVKKLSFGNGDGDVGTWTRKMMTNTNAIAAQMSAKTVSYVVAGCPFNKKEI